MATSLSAYWVDFFQKAGFSLDVATKHAVVFSNNRIKPDMLPDLDKPSLKEMGITLMGDMISILRYAKKVSDEMTCERFLVDSVDKDSPRKILNSKAVVKKVLPKILSDKKLPPIATATKTITNNSTKLTVNPPKVVKKVSEVKLIPKKKVTVNPNRIIKQTIVTKKRKLVAANAGSEDDDGDVDEDANDKDDLEWESQINKRLRITNDKNDFKVVSISKTNPAKDSLPKKTAEPKRTVFDRLGDSSVTSTTNTNDIAGTTFNITGLGSDIFKRNSSVFNRLGDRDVKKDSSAGIFKNDDDNQPQGILKVKPSNLKTTTVKLQSPITSSGTMHADHESKTVINSSIKLRTSKSLPIQTIKTTKMPTSKLASEQTKTLPAKARLGVSGSHKQVTFNKIATVNQYKKSGVFSRLGF